MLFRRSRQNIIREKKAAGLLMKAERHASARLDLEYVSSLGAIRATFLGL